MPHDFMPGLAGIPAAKSAISDVDGQRRYCWNIAASASKNFVTAILLPRKPRICCYLDTFPRNRSSRDGTRTSSITVASSSRLSIY